MPTSIGTYIDQTQQVPGTWAGGTTHKIYAYPADPAPTIASAQFWLGTAVIQQDAPYSFFAERTRIQIPIRGNGIQLHFQEPAETITLDTNAAYRFDGARPVYVQLVQGPIVALNVIFHTDVIAEARVVRFEQQQHVLADIAAVTHDTAIEAKRTMLQIVYVITGALTIHPANESAIMLQSGDAFVIHPHRVTEPAYPPTLLERTALATDIIITTAWLP